MKKLIAIAALSVPLLTACVTDTSFSRQDGVCYRTRTEKAFFFVPMSEKTVQAVDANCAPVGG